MKSKFERRFLKQDKAEIRTVEKENNLPVITGYFAKFNVMSEDMWGFRERIEPGFFAEALKNSDVVDLLNHDVSEIMGRESAYGDEGKLELWEDEFGLAYRVTPPDTQYVRDKFLTPIRLGLIQGNSFGFYTKEDGYRLEPDPENQNSWIRNLLPNGCEELLDGSQVVYPAYPDTELQLRSINAEMALEQIKKAETRETQNLETQKLDGEYEDLIVNQIKERNL